MREQSVQVRCPNCGKQVARDAPAFPFCSERCRLVDLGRWLAGDYRIPDETPASTPAGDKDDAS